MINFVNIDAEKIKADLLNYFEEETGEVLAEGDPLRNLVLSFVPVIVGIMNQLNFTGNMNLTQFAKDNYLDKLGERFGVIRFASQKSKTVLKFTLSSSQETDVRIPQNTKVTPGGSIVFFTTQLAVIKAGNTDISVEATAEYPGSKYNDFPIGSINKMIDQIVFVESATNTITSFGGSEAEDDESYRQRIMSAPESFSVAGPIGAYKFWVSSVSSEIIDNNPISLTPGTVSIYVLTKSGVLSEELKSKIYSVVSAEKHRPLTDRVEILPAIPTNYKINLSYTVNDDVNSQMIENDVNMAVDKYVNWQGDRLGKNINPDELRKLVLNAGASTVNLTLPIYTDVNNNSFAKNIEKVVEKI